MFAFLAPLLGGLGAAAAPAAAAATTAAAGTGFLGSLGSILGTAMGGLQIAGGISQLMGGGGGGGGGSAAEEEPAPVLDRTPQIRHIDTPRVPDLNDTSEHNYFPTSFSAGGAINRGDFMSQMRRFAEGGPVMTDVPDPDQGGIPMQGMPPQGMPDQQMPPQGGMVPQQEGAPVGQEMPDAGAQREIVKGAIAAIEGKHPNPKEAIELFLEFFGPDAFEELATDVKSEMKANEEMPHAEKALMEGMRQGGAKNGLDQITGGTGGGPVKGAGDGMSDSIPAEIDGQTPARIATDEFVVPADVVSGLGNGSSDAGHASLMQMLDSVRSAKNGSPEQPPAIDPRQHLPR